MLWESSFNSHKGLSVQVAVPDSHAVSHQLDGCFSVNDNDEITGVEFR